MSVILIVEDVPAMREQYAYDLRRLGEHETREAETVAAARDVLTREPIDCVLLDLELPGEDGFAFLETLRSEGSELPVLVYTGTGDYDRCVRAVKLGAFGFLDKAEPMERVVREIEHALERGRLAREVRQLKERLDEESSLVGESTAMTDLRQAIRRLAPIPSPVLVVGESGTGKELVALDLHRLSPRAEHAFLPVNCAALPESLVESELFGHERGAFTGADRVRRGAFEAAGEGTLFLDEIGELPLPAQAKLLRVLEDERVTRLGGDKPVRVAARVVAATNRDLDAEVEAGRFRADLLFRLNVHIVRVPPLRERTGDVPILVRHFLGVTAKRFGSRAKGIAEEATALLAAHGWRRNNVRELRNIVERLVIAAPGETIGPEVVPAELGGTSPAAPATPDDDLFRRAGALRDLKAEAERRLVVGALERNGWHVTRTAEELGLADHASLSKIMRRHGIKRPGA
jgi:DNA-binding NtrC family response regulator